MAQVIRPRDGRRDPPWHTGPMADLLFEDPELAALYDPLCPRDERGDYGFYLPMILSAGSVLDVVAREVCSTKPAKPGIRGVSSASIPPSA